MAFTGFSFFSKAPASGGTGGGGFIGYTETHTSGSGTSTVPSGAAVLKVECYSKGGSGGTKSGTGKGGGGSSGTYSTKTFAVAAGDYGKSIAWNTDTGTVLTVVGDATGTNITNSTLNISCPNGNNGGASSGGAAPSAPTGGSTNNAGNAGAASSGGGTGGNAPGPTGGSGGAAFTDGISPGGGGGGGNDTTSGPGAGGSPRIILTWS